MATTSWTRGECRCSANWLWEGKFPLETWETPRHIQPRLRTTLKLREEVAADFKTVCGSTAHCLPSPITLFHADNVILGSVSASLPGDPRTTGNLHDSQGNPHDSLHCLTPFLHHLKINRNKRGFPFPPSQMEHGSFP